MLQALPCRQRELLRLLGSLPCRQSELLRLLGSLPCRQWDLRLLGCSRRSSWMLHTLPCRQWELLCVLGFRCITLHLQLGGRQLFEIRRQHPAVWSYSES